MSHYPPDDESMDRLLMDLVKQGQLRLEVDEQEIDMILSNTNPVQLSEHFSDRALAAVQAAQKKRAATLPTAEIGTQIATARVEKGLAVVELAEHLGLTSEELEKLERGELSVQEMMHIFAPQIMVKLIEAVRIPLGDLTEKLMSLTRVMPKTAQAAARTYRRLSSTNQLVEQLAEYVDSIERLSQSQ